MSMFNQTLSFYGLLLNAFGSVALIFSPSYYSSYTSNGEQEVAFVSNQTVEGKKIYRFKQITNKAGWVLLLSGFILEIIDAYK